MRLPFGVHSDDFLLQLGDAVADLAPVKLGVRFAGTAPAGAAALPSLRPGELGGFAQARRHVAQPGDLDLGAGGTRGGVAMEDFEDDHGTVHDLATGFLLQVARLRGRYLVVHEDRVDPARLGVGGSMAAGFEGAGGGLHVDERADFLALA